MNIQGNNSQSVRSANAQRTCLVRKVLNDKYLIHINRVPEIPET